MSVRRLPEWELSSQGLRRPVEVRIIDGPIRHALVFADVIGVIVRDGDHEIERMGARLEPSSRYMVEP